MLAQNLVRPPCFIGKHKGVRIDNERATEVQSVHGARGILLEALDRPFADLRRESQISISSKSSRINSLIY